MTKQYDFVDASGCHLIRTVSQPTRLDTRGGGTGAEQVARLGLGEVRRGGLHGALEVGARRGAGSTGDGSEVAPGDGVGAHGGGDFEIQGARELIFGVGKIFAPVQQDAAVEERFAGSEV